MVFDTKSCSLLISVSVSGREELPRFPPAFFSCTKLALDCSAGLFFSFGLFSVFIFQIFSWPITSKQTRLSPCIAHHSYKYQWIHCILPAGVSCARCSAQAPKLGNIMPWSATCFIVYFGHFLICKLGIPSFIWFRFLHQGRYRRGGDWKPAHDSVLQIRDLHGHLGHELHGLSRCAV